VPLFTLLTTVGWLVARGESHRRAWELLGVAPGDRGGFRAEELYADARPCIEALRRRGDVVGAAGNYPTREEPLLRELVDVVGSSDRWGAEKPSPGFFARLVVESGFEPSEAAYVGDRVDNDVVPARAAGLLAVHLRRGPRGRLQAGADQAHIRIDSLDELPRALADGR